MASSLETAPVTRHLKPGKQWSLGLVGFISSIYTSKDDNQIFLSDFSTGQIIEYDKEGKFVYRCELTERGEYLHPYDICCSDTDPQILIIACGLSNNLCFLTRTGTCPSLKLKQIHRTEKKYVSLCLLNNQIYACSFYLGVDLISEEGRVLRSIRSEEMHLESDYHRIRGDPCTGNVWVLNFNQQLFCYDREGKLLQMHGCVENEDMDDISVDNNGCLYFCNRKGIFSQFPLNQVWSFEKNLPHHGRISLKNKKIFISSRFGQKNLIKEFDLLSL